MQQLGRPLTEVSSLGSSSWREGEGERVRQRTVEQIPDTLPDRSQNSPQERVQHRTAALGKPRIRHPEQLSSSDAAGNVQNCSVRSHCTVESKRPTRLSRRVQLPAKSLHRGSAFTTVEVRQQAVHEWLCVWLRAGLDAAVPAGTPIDAPRIVVFWGQEEEERMAAHRRTNPGHFAAANCHRDKSSMFVIAPSCGADCRCPQKRVHLHEDGTRAPQPMSRWTLRNEGFSHFAPEEKSAKTRRQSSANMLSHSMPSTGAACEIEHLQYGELWWRRQWDPDSWWLVDPKDGARVGPINMTAPLGARSREGLKFAGLGSIRRIWFRGSRAALPLLARAVRIRIWTLSRRVLFLQSLACCLGVAVGSVVHSTASKNARIQECTISIRCSAACSEVEQDFLWPSMAHSFYCVLSRAQGEGLSAPCIN